MTELNEAMARCSSEQISALVEYSLVERDRAAAAGNRGWAAIQDATLGAAVDERNARLAAERELIEVMTFGRVVE